MKTYTLNAIRYTLILAAALLLPMGTAYAYDVSDSNDRLSSGSSSVFSPGYINAAKQKTEAIINQLNPKKSFMERLVENITNGVFGNVDKAADTKVVAEIKKKTSAIGTQANTTLVDSTLYDMAIGSGTDKTYNANGRMLSEVINGIRHVYVGFDNVGTVTIQDALNTAITGSRVIVKSGVYNENIRLANGVIILGGYNNNGARDINNTSTTIIGVIKAAGLSDYTEINGFNIMLPDYGENYSLFYQHNIYVSSGVNLGIVNNTFTARGGYQKLANGSNAINSYGSVSVQNNVFNSYGSSININKGSFSIIGNNFNSYTGGRGMVIVGVTYETRGSVINNNFTGGGIYTIGSVNVTSTNNNYLGSYGVDRRSGSVTSNNDYFAVGNLGTLTINNPVSQTNSLTATDSKISITRAMTTISSTDVDSNLDRIHYGENYNVSILDYATIKSLTNNLNSTVSGIVRFLINNKDGILNGSAGISDNALAGGATGDSLKAYALSALQGGASQQETEIAMRLAQIMKNPTEDQKLIIDAIANLLKDISKIEGETGKSEELKKAEDELLQMVAAVLLVQGIPDLLKEGDVENIKGMFKDLGASKDKVIMDYKESIKPYYNSIAKEIAANIAILETKGIVKRKLTEEELRKIEPREIDRILENIRKNNDKSFEFQYILQQDSKYRKEYLDPSNKLMEGHMKDILGSFARKLNEALEEKK